MIEFLTNNMAPIMFAGLIVFLLMGFSVAFSLGACGLLFGVVGIQLGIMNAELMQALSTRLLYGIMQNETLLAIPFFTFMGLILERSGMAEDLLDTIGQLFGPIRGGLAYAVIFVGAMLAATTGVVAASVISMGLISLPIMLRYGYDRRIATGTIAASGTLAQIIPPSLVLIILADQLGRSVGDLYKGAFIPGFVLTAMYTGFVLVVSLWRPQWVPALPAEARTIREDDGSAGLRSLGVLLILSVAAALAFETIYLATKPLDETIVLTMCVGVGVAFALAVLVARLQAVDRPRPFLLRRPLRLDLADRRRDDRDLDAAQLLDHRDAVADVLDRRRALRLVLGQQVAVGEHQGDRPPARQLVILEQLAHVLGVVALRLAADLDRVVATAREPGDRVLDRLGAHPVVHRNLHSALSSKRLTREARLRDRCSQQPRSLPPNAVRAHQALAPTPNSQLPTSKALPTPNFQPGRRYRPFGSWELEVGSWSLTVQRLRTAPAA
jgi:hypothetical protein